MADCASCYEPLESPDALWMEMVCGHNYCYTCMEKFLRKALTDGPFPPKCCGELNAFHKVEQFRSTLPDDLRTKLDEKLEEVEASDRTYCSVPTCSTFIRPANISGNDGTCPSCGNVTCVACKAASHAGACPATAADAALGQLLQTAVAEGWKMCGNCHSMIERTEGCNHMV